MRIINVNRTKPGDVLGKSMFNERSELMLAAGHTLNEDMIRLIKRRGVRYVYIMDEITKEIVPEEVIEDYIRQAVSGQINTSFQKIKNHPAFQEFTPGKIEAKITDLSEKSALLDMNSIRKNVILLIEEIVDHNMQMFVSLPIKSKSGHQYEHALDTAIICLLIGQYFKYDYRELKELGTAALVHDIGKMLFVDIADRTQNELSKKEKILVSEHPTYSMLLVKASDSDAYSEQSTVLQHHERQDGKGYPQGLRGQHLRPMKNRKHDSSVIFRHAEILAVANVYDNLISGVVDGVDYSPAGALTQMVNNYADALNKSVIQALSKVVQCFPVGATVRIRKTTFSRYVGFEGIIVKSNPERQAYPVILLTSNNKNKKIEPRLVDFTGEELMELELAI